MSEQGDTIVEEGTVVDEAPHLKRWTFALVLVPVWVVAAIVGLALYLWWYHSIDKTPALFVVLVSAPFASTAAASVLYGIYFCDRASRCLLGLVPY